MVMHSGWNPQPMWATIEYAVGETCISGCVRWSSVGERDPRMATSGTWGVDDGVVRGVDICGKYEFMPAPPI